MIKIFTQKGIIIICMGTRLNNKVGQVTLNAFEILQF